MSFGPDHEYIMYSTEQLELNLRSLREFLLSDPTTDAIVDHVRHMPIITNSIMVPKCQGVKKDGTSCCLRASTHFNLQFCKIHGCGQVKKDDVERMKQSGHVICHYRHKRGTMCKTKCPVDERLCYRHRHLGPSIKEEKEEDEDDDGLVDTFSPDYELEIERRVREAIPTCPSLSARPRRDPTVISHCGLCDAKLGDNDLTDLCHFCSVRRCDHVCCLSPIDESTAPSFKGWKFCQYHAFYAHPKDEVLITMYKNEIEHRTNYIDRSREQKRALWSRIANYYAYRENEYVNYSEGFRDVITSRNVEMNYEFDREIFGPLDSILFKWDLRPSIDSVRLTSLFPFEKKEDYIMYYRPSRRCQWQTE